jgi:hypothetical protein
MRYCVFATVLGMLVLSGCGGVSNVEVKGLLMKKGSPYQPPAKTQVTLVFKPEIVDSEQTYIASYSIATGIYTVELPPGKYRTNLLLVDHNTRPGIPKKVRPEFSQTIHEIKGATTLDLDIDP